MFRVAQRYGNDDSSDSDSEESLNLYDSQRPLDSGGHRNLERMVNPSLILDDMLETRPGKSLRSLEDITKKALYMTLQQAARDGRIDIVQHHLLLIGKDKRKLNKLDQEQTTALHYAVRYGHFGIVKLLVESGASLNVQGEFGATPLHYATRYVFKTLRKTNGLPSLSQTLVSAPPKKNKERDSMLLRNFALFNSHKVKESLPKSDKKIAAPAKKKNFTNAKGWKSTADSLSGDHLPLKEMRPLDIQSNNSSFSGGLDKLQVPSLRGDLDASSGKLSTEQLSAPIKINRFSVQTVKSPLLQQQTPSSHSRKTSNGLLTRKSDLDGLCIRREAGVEETPFTNNDDSLLPMSGFPDCEDRPVSDDLTNQYYESSEVYQDAFSKMRRHSAPSVVGQTDVADLENRACPILQLSMNSVITGYNENAMLTESNAKISDVGYPSDNPALVFAGALSSDEISGVNALILPSLCQVAIEPNDDALEPVDKRTISLPDIKTGLVGGDIGVVAAGVVGLKLAGPTSPQVKRVSVVSGKLNFKHNLKTGAVRPLLIPKKCYVGKASAGDAAGSEDDSILKYLLEKRADQNARDYNGCTPLHYAAMRGNVAAARQLLSQQNVSTIKEAKDRTRMTPLHYAASSGAYEMCELLLEHGANLRCVDEEDMTPLHFAAMEGYIEIVRLLFRVAESRGGWEEISKLVMDQDRDEQTALHLAVENGHIDVVQACIDKGAKVNLVTANLMTPLHLASTSGQLDMVQLLLKHDADTEAKNTLQETPLHRAALFNRFNVVKFLLDKRAIIDCRDKDKETPLTMAVRKNNVETVQVLLERSADVTVKDANDKTCLYLAAEEDCVKTCELLVQHPEVKGLLEEFDKNENTPLHVAAMKGHIKIVKMLLEAGACIDAKNDTNLTPLHLAAKHGRTRIVKLLLTQDISIVNDEDDASNTPLHLAALEGHVKVVKILLQCGAAVDARNANLWTPLDCAANRGWTWCAEALLDGDSLVNPQDKAKTTPLHLACKEGHVDMINLLLSRKADITRRDHLGRNCLDWAIENKQRDAAIALLSSNNWQAAMRNCSVDGNDVTTPMRKLIKNLPDVAEKVFNQCMTGNNLPRDHPFYEVKYNYEFLEDSFTDWGPRFYDANNHEINYKRLFSQQVVAGSPNQFSRIALWKDHLRKINVLGYGQQQSQIMQNHPLMFMVRSERTKLLCHPLVTYLLRHKWQACGRYFYYSRLLLYAVFLIFLSCYAMTITTEEFTRRCPGVNDANSSDGNCTKMCLPVVKPVDNLKRRVFVDFGQYIVFVLATFSLLLELAAFVREIFTHIHIRRAIDISGYVLSMIYSLEGMTWNADGATIHIVDNARCTMWHRSVGALALLAAWVSLVMFMRKFPKIGIYILMYSHLLKTFAQFFVVFLLFIVANALAFHIIMYEQDPLSFVTPFRSMVKVLVGMLGEIAFDPVFNRPSAAKIPAVAYVIFLVYIVTAWTLLMRMLIGLAVMDIKGVQEQAVLARLAMQVDLTLDVEKALPPSWQRRLATMEETVRPNDVRAFSMWAFWSLRKASPSGSADAQPSALERIQKQLGDARETLLGQRNKLRTLEGQHSRMDTMLAALLKHYGIHVEYEVDKEEHR